MTRRCFLATPVAFLAVRERVSREIFIRSPGRGTAVDAYAFYTQASGGAMVSVEERSGRSDTIDVAYYRYSRDYGHTWSPPIEKKTRERRPDGVLCRYPRCGYVDPKTGLYIEFWNEAILPSDDVGEWLRHANIHYAVEGAVHQVIQQGAEFDAGHPLPGVYTGKNTVMIGDVPCVPITLKDGSILLPAQITPLGPDGKLYNPTGGATYTDAAVLHGRWRGKILEWRVAKLVKGDPEKSTRGMVEPTIERLADGRLILVMRGSNDSRPYLPGYRWISYSNDGGWNWTTPKPWTYSSGDSFYSPSSCSQLLRHSNGKLYWLGNISPTNPRGNRPRFPFYVGEVDQNSGLLIRDSLILVDDRQPGEDEILTLSNFYAREDRQTRQIALHMTRTFTFREGWVGDALLYRIEV